MEPEGKRLNNSITPATSRATMLQQQLIIQCSTVVFPSSPLIIAYKLARQFYIQKCCGRATAVVLRHGTAASSLGF